MLDDEARAVSGGRRLGVAALALTMLLAGCEGEVSTPPDPVEVVPCEEAREHLETCDMQSLFSEECPYVSEHFACEASCQATAPCSAFTGEDAEARVKLYKCSTLCSCKAKREFVAQCGGDTSDIPCERMLNTCPCPYTRDCDAVLTDWVPCLEDNFDDCFPEEDG